jgi:hypothetical protein
MGKVFHVSQGAISQRINNNKRLKLLVTNKTNTSTINEILSGKKQSEVANNYDITQGRVAQIWGD